MNSVIDNLKDKLRLCFNRRGLFENNAMLVLVILFVTSLIFLPLACSQPPDSISVWDKPLGSPQYLLHATGHGTMDGPRTDDWWFLNPNQPKNGFIELPDGMGGTFTYSIDQSMGPFNTPREVCSAAGGKTKDNSIGGFNCKDMASQPGKPNQPNQPEGDICANACDKSRHLVWDGYAGCSCICEDGWKFDEQGNCEPKEVSEMQGELEAEIEIMTPQGTTQAKPGDKGQIELSPGQKAEIDAKCNEMKTALALLLLTSTRERGDIKDITEPPALGHEITYNLIQIACESLKSGKPINFQKAAEFADVSSSSAIDYPVKLEFGLQSGSLRIETVHDQVALDVKTPTVTVSSAGKNTFDIAYYPNSGSSLLSAYQNPIQIQPINSNLAPFTLGSGQQVEVSSSGTGPITAVGQTTGGSTYVSPNGKDMYGTAGGKQGGCRTDPLTGVVTCVDTIGDFSNPQGPNQGSSDRGGCYKDPMTGTIACVDSNGNPINTQSGSKTNQPGLGLSVPQSLDECETYTSEICGTWTLHGDHINAVWNNGAKATLDVEQFDNNGVVIIRQDTEGSSAGLTARYEGRPIGNHVDGSVTWNWNGSTWSGTWKADW